MRRVYIAFLVIILLLPLAACGRQAHRDRQSESEAVQTAVGDTYWTKERWIHNGKAGDISLRPLYLQEEVRGMDMELPGEYDGHSVEYCTLGNTVYGLEGFYRQEGDVWERSYYISRYDGTKEELEHWPIELPQPEEYGAEELFAASFDVMAERELVLFLQGQQNAQSRMACYLAVHMTPEGEILSVTDLSPAMQELGVEPEVTFEEAYVDGAGYYYLIPRKADLGQGDNVTVLDPQGEIVGNMPPGDGYAGAERATKLPDGSIVFSWSNQERQSIMLGIFDRENKAVRTLLEEDLLGSWLWTPAEDGYLYYIDGSEELMRCNIRTGSVENCMYYPQLGLEEGKSSAHSMGMIIGKSGEPEILGHRGGETVICRLGTEAADTDTVRLVSLTPYCDNLKDCVASFSREHAQCPIQLEYPEDASDADSAEAYRSRVMAELVSGNGADMYYVWPSDMRMLQEKGALADLAELISEDTLSAIWPGVLEMGTLDGQLSGILPADYASTMIVPEELWPEDHWTLEEALDVMEAHRELQYPVMSNSMLDQEKVFSCLVMQNLAESPFLNLQEGRSDFDNPLFIRALELAGSYTESLSYEEVQELYPRKSWVAMEIPIDMLYDYDLYKTALGENYHVVGYPTEGESGTYWYGYMFLIVNQETKHKDQIAAFLEYMLSYETQYRIPNPVRRDMLENRIEEFEICVGFGAEMRMESRIGFALGEGDHMELHPGPEGDYRIGEYREVMERCAGRSADTDAIEDIIWDEVGSYFAGDRDAAAVADSIQNRVQLYLEEQR